MLIWINRSIISHGYLVLLEVIKLPANSIFTADVLLELYSYTEEPEFFFNKKCFDEMSLAFGKFDYSAACFCLK